MSRIVGLLVVGVFGGPALADSAPTVAELVAQLGDPKFATREQAQKALLARGEGIVPELDKLAKTADAETAERIGKVRYELVGYLDDIKRLLVAVDNRPYYVPEPISNKLRDLITGHQPRAGEFLLQLATDPKHDLHLRATRAFLQTWQSANAAQLDRYIQSSVTLTTNHRSKFPAKVGAMIPMEAKIRGGWEGWFPLTGDTLALKTRTTRYLDGKPYDKPFDSKYPFATVGWYKVGELAEGKHTIHALLEYEFTHRGEKRKGEIRSKESTFEVIAADTPDDLIAPRSEALTKQVRSKFAVRESEYDPRKFTGYQPGTLPAQGAEYEWSPQVTWVVKPGVKAGLHCPVRLMSGALPDVDLCFDVEIHDVKTATVYPADPVVVRRGLHVERSWIIPRDVRAFAKGREGFVTVKVLLKPSRALALGDPDVKRYYPDPITSDEFRMKVYQKVEVLP
ncbi:MAG TPA: hypothetical protein VKE40_14310 [Gemmataceae bacterium]|nr:hypothetical protein [Gemmataceae bacterium]